MRKYFLWALLLVGVCAWADEGAGDLAIRLRARRIIDVQPAQKVGNDLYTPIAVRYVRDGDGAPSCGLVLKGGGYVDLVSPEVGGALPACAAPVKAPVYIFLKDSYVVYEYYVEDPRATVVRMFQLYRLDGGVVEVCRNDDLLTDFANKATRKKGVAGSFRLALMRFGCSR